VPPRPRALLSRLAREENGQDLIEFALLAVFIAVLSVLVWPDIVTRMGQGFNSWGTTVQSRWIPDPPK